MVGLGWFPPYARPPRSRSTGTPERGHADKEALKPLVGADVGLRRRCRSKWVVGMGPEDFESL
jgi:hypothetical protein